MRNFLVWFSSTMLAFIQLNQYYSQFWSNFFIAILVGVLISSVTFRSEKLATHTETEKRI
jgi:hypothetical protein